MCLDAPCTVVPSGSVKLAHSGHSLSALQVLLRLPDADKGSKVAMVYACSWWDAAHVSEYLKDSSRPIWESLSQGRTELYRDIQQVYCGHSDYLEE